MGIIAFSWGILGVSLLIGSAVWRLGKISIEAFTNYELTLLQWTVAVVWFVFMVFSEGYRGFQKKFAPRVAARALYLSKSPRLIWLIFAPLFCMGYFHATRKRKIISYTITILIVCMVIAVRQLAQPWRGIIDLGVIAGLSWGLISLWFFCLQAILYPNFGYDPEVPEKTEI